MDSLDIHGGLGGALSLTLGYAHGPLRVREGADPLWVVSQQAYAAVGIALTYDRWRFYLNFDAPLVIIGQSGTADGVLFSGPSVHISSHPDLLSDPRVGVDVRIFGEPGGRFRLGASAQLVVPSGDPADFDTDGTFRGLVRLLFAGDVGTFAFAGNVGVHIRPRDDFPVPEFVHGSELLFGVGAGPRIPLGAQRAMALIVGPEVFGATAFRSLFAGQYTALEGLLSVRVEGTRPKGPQVRVKLGVGGGMHPHFGAPEWRVVCGVEVFNPQLGR
jgi:hypothetical protein